MIAMSDKAAAGKSIFVLLLLIVAGFLGNYFTVPLFFGADFIFGGVAVFLVIYFYGLGWGMLAAAIVHSYTFFLWGHPYGFLNFLCEALFVGIFLRKGHRNLPGLDWAFWLFVGMPLVSIEHGVLMHMDMITTLFIMLKQAINGIFDALLASLVICHLPVSGFLQRPHLSKHNTLQASLCDVMVTMVLLPALLLTMVQIKKQKVNLEDAVITELQSLSTNVQLHLRTWNQFDLHTLQALATLAGESSMTPSEGLQRQTEILRRSIPDFRSMHVEDTTGHAISFDPKVNENGESTVGMDLSDRAWFQISRAKQQPVVSEVFMGRAASFFPIVAISVPIFRENTWLGSCTATLDLKRIQQILQPYQSNKAAASITLTDFQNRVLASTAPERPPLQPWNWKESGVSQVLGNIYLWRPDGKNLPTITRWAQSYYVQETSVEPELPWKLTTEAPVAPLQRVLYSVYVKNLAIMACLTTLCLLLSHILSRGLTRPLTQLAQVTADLPEKLSKAQEIDWPASSTAEIDSLIGNFKSMAKSLDVNFHRLQVQSDGLKQTNLRLQQEIEERQQAQEDLKRSISLLNATLESTADGILAVGEKGRVIVTNAKFSELWQIPEELTAAKDDVMLLDYVAGQVKDPEGFLEKIRNLYAAAQEDFDTLYFADGRIFERLSRPLLLDGLMSGRVWSFRDVTMQRKAEEALRESEDHFRTLVQSAPDAIFIQTEGRYSYVNDAGIRLYGAVSEKELLGRDVVERVHPDYRAKILQRIQSVNEKGMPAPLMEQKHLKLDGTTIDTETHAVPIRYRKSEGALVFIRDITERKKTEESLLLSEDRYRRLFEDAVLGIFRTSPEGKFINVNPAFARMFCFDSPEETKSQVNAAGVYADPSSRTEIVRMILDARGPICAEYRYKRKDGNIFPGNLHAWAVRDREGRLLYFEGFIEDITERREAEAARLRLEKAIEQIAEGIMISDANFIIQYSNPAFEQITGYGRSEILGQHMRIFKSARQGRAFYKNIRDTLKRGDVWSGRIQAMKKDGTVYEVEALTSPVRDESGTITNYISIRRDITREVRLESELHQAQKMEAIGTLAGGIAHDFNNLLAPIIGYAEMNLLNTPALSPARRGLEQILNAGIRASDLVKQILTFSRFTPKQQLVPIDIGSDCQRGPEALEVFATKHHRNQAKHRKCCRALPMQRKSIKCCSIFARTPPMQWMAKAFWRSGCPVSI